MHWATAVGLVETLRRITALEAAHGSRTWAPAPLLQRRVAEEADSWD